ncbi:hypothetical protein, partial [Parasynechococcus sp.]|uniref:hypothetical protein n=1 Tax=Parasynechococcus sp. TaxID=3101203 RepID=UPI003704D213
ASHGEPTSFYEHLDWLKSVLHQVEGMAGTVLLAHFDRGLEPQGTGSGFELQPLIPAPSSQ